jgi:hypothetical protein
MKNILVTGGAGYIGSRCVISVSKKGIIANSSFSWWGAWLNGNANKIVIAPQIWLQSESLITKDFIPNSWLQI